MKNKTSDHLNYEIAKQQYLQKLDMLYGHKLSQLVADILMDRLGDNTLDQRLEADPALAKLFYSYLAEQFGKMCFHNFGFSPFQDDGHQGGLF